MGKEQKSMGEQHALISDSEREQNSDSPFPASSPGPTTDTLETRLEQPMKLHTKEQPSMAT